MISRITFLVLFLVFFAIRFPYQMKHKDKEMTKDNYNVGFEKFITIFQMFSMVIFPVIFVIIPTPKILSIPLPFGVWILSVVLSVLSLVLFFVVHKNLGNYWSPMLEVQEKHKLVDTGIYRYIRHPMYTQMWMWVICQGFVLQNWLVEIVGVVGWAMLYFTRVPKEEEMLVDTFGNDYIQYMKTTGRVLPKIKSIRE